jgi:6-phosphogluconolactonase
MPSQRMFAGTYTHDTGSAGIYELWLDDSGQISAGLVLPHDANPSWLTLDVSGRFLCAGSELEDRAGVTVYDLQQGLNPLLTSQFTLTGSALCYLSCPPDGQALLGACYSSGTLFSLSFDQDGQIQSILSSIDHRLFDPSGEKEPHAHCIVSDKAGQFAIAVDLGLDSLFVYQIDSGHLVPARCQHRIQLSPGEGPRHLVFHPVLDLVYVVSEYGNNILSFSYDPLDGLLEPLQKTNILPDGFNGASYGADIRISSDGRQLFASSRGADIIACYKIDDQGWLQSAGHLSAQGQWPRSFSLSPDGQYLVVAAQHSNLVTVLSLQPGENFGQPVSAISIPEPVAICFTATVMK